MSALDSVNRLGRAIEERQQRSRGDSTSGLILPNDVERSARRAEEERHLREALRSQQDQAQREALDRTTAADQQLERERSAREQEERLESALRRSTESFALLVEAARNGSAQDVSDALEEVKKSQRARMHIEGEPTASIPTMAGMA